MTQAVQVAGAVSAEHRTAGRRDHDLGRPSREIIGGEIDLTYPCSNDASDCIGIYIAKSSPGAVFVEGVWIHNPHRIGRTCAGGASRTLQACDDHADVFQPYQAPDDTSRERLDIPGEFAFPVPPLGLPEDGSVHAVAVSEAGLLFAERAAHQAHDRPVAQEIEDLARWFDLGLVLPPG